VCAGILLAATFASCAPNRPIGNAGTPPPGTGGTISGLVSAGNMPVSGRKVTAINQSSTARFETTTATNGGYTVQVPAGTYRLELELREGERLMTQPEPTDVGVGDLDAERNFVITR
jgi:hypothetical protein